MRDTLLGKRGRLALLVLGMVAGAVVVLTVYAVVTAAAKSTQIRDAQEVNTAKSDARDETLAIVKSCVEPEGECNKRNQRRLAGAIADIGAANIVTVVCALDVPNGTPLDTAIRQVTECVTQRLSERPKP